MNEAKALPNFLGLKPESGSLLNIDFLRFIASIGIVYHHSHLFFLEPSLREAASQRTGGLALFVDLFFMISGYVMAFVYSGRLNTARDYKIFLWRRVARLYPLHLLLLVLSIFAWAILLTRGSSSTAPSFSPACILNTALLLQEYINCGSPFVFNGVVWSISIEMGMYLLLPLLLLLAGRWLKLFALLCFALLCLAIISIAIWLYYPEIDWEALPNLLRGLVSFPLGILVFILAGRTRNIEISPWIVPILTAIAFVSMILGAPQLLIFCLLFFLFTVAVISDRNQKVSPAVWHLAPLGQLTFSIYIWHSLWILIFMNVIADKLMRGNLAILTAMSILTYVTIFATAYFGYFRVEVPARRWLSRLPQSFKKRGHSLGSS